ncbi:DUF3093 domain-containing protein [Corynebacterium camporealensis]
MTDSSAPKVLYQERQWVPWYFWLLAAAAVIIATATVSFNRGIWWTIVPGVLLSAIAIWVLLSWSSTTVTVEQDTDGTRWLLVKDAQLPHDVVSRCMAVPESARRNALGPQLDPAAFLVTHGWVKKHAMLVLDDPEDPTPYWLICSKNPQAVLDAFVPNLVKTAHSS